MIADCGLRIADSDCGLAIADCGLRTSDSDCGLPIAECDCGFQIVDWGIVDCGSYIRTSNNPQSAIGIGNPQSAIGIGSPQSAIRSVYLPNGLKKNSKSEIRST
jgi:hypothetical protein